MHPVSGDEPRRAAGATGVGGTESGAGRILTRAALGTVAVGAAVAFIARAQHVLPAYPLAVLNFLGVTVILVVSLTVTNGFAGLFSLGHPAFMAVGAYTAALLTYPPVRKRLMLSDLPQWLSAVQWPLVPATVAAGVAALAVAVVIGIPLVRLRGHYLALATLGLIVVVGNLVTNARGITRGPLGLTGVPALANTWHVAGWAAATLVTAWRVRNSRFGRALFAIRSDEAAAAVLGIPVASYRLLALAIGAFYAGVAGALWGHLVTTVAPSSFSVGLAFQLVAMSVVGGWGSISGAVTGATVLSLVGEALRPLESRHGLYGLSQMVTASVLVLVLILRPRGLFGSGEISWEWIESWWGRLRRSGRVQPERRAVPPAVGQAKRLHTEGSVPEGSRPGPSALQPPDSCTGRAAEGGERSEIPRLPRHPEARPGHTSPLPKGRGS